MDRKEPYRQRERETYLVGSEAVDGADSELDALVDQSGEFLVLHLLVVQVPADLLDVHAVVERGVHLAEKPKH